MERVVLGKFIKEYSKKNKENNPYPVYSVTNSNGFCTEYFTKDVSSEDKRNYKIVPFGYFAYNPSRINVGSVDCQQKEPYVVVSPLYTVFSVSSDLDKNYLKYFFKSRYCSNLINSKVSGSVRNNLKFNILSTFELPYCSVEKQQQAVKQFENIKSLINCEVKQLSLLDELIKSRFNEMFGDVLHKSNNRKIKDACTSMVRGPFGSALKKEYFVPKGEKTYKVYEQKHAIQKDHTIGSYYVSEEKFYSLRRFEVKPGDIIMSCSGTIGEFYQLPPGCEKGLMNQALLKFTLDRNMVNETYFLQAMSLIIGDVDRSGTAIQNITSVSIIKETNLFIPNIDAQNTFASFVNQIDKLKFVRPVLNGGLMHA